jgi:hypothetical protein
LTQDWGLLAMARCQYAWSLNTVAKFPKYQSIVQDTIDIFHIDLKLTNDIDNSKYQSILRAHRQITAMRVSSNWSLSRGLYEQLVHPSRAPDLWRRRVGGKDEGEDDGEEHSGMCIVAQKCGTHAASYNIDRNADWDKETGSDGVHPSEIVDGCGSAKDEHGGYDTVQ